MYSRHKGNDLFYKGKKWRRKRENILRRDDYTCKECSRYGKTTLATTVHHIYPLETHLELGLTNENLISLCNKCHEQMHNRFTNELTNKGLAWQSRIRIA
jgi:5-methylcytosine-specific restriction endonuclease McrA